MEFRFYVGVDWATEQHQACVMNAQGEVVQQHKIEHSGKGILDFIAWMEALAEGEAERIAASIEVPRGPMVEAFLEHQWAVFSITKQLDRFRDRHTVAGAKDDRRDAYVLADSLRTDPHCFRRLQPDHPSFATEYKCAQIYPENRPAVITVLTVVTDWYTIQGHSGTEIPFAPGLGQIWLCLRLPRATWKSRSLA